MKHVKIRVNFQCLKDILLSYRQNLQGLGLQKMSWKEDYYWNNLLFLENILNLSCKLFWLSVFNVW